MNKLDASPPTFTLSPVSHSDPSTRSGRSPEPAPRLIVLFPASETDTPDLEHRIWEIARSLHLNVLFLSVTNNFDEEAQIRRKLITMAAVIKDPNVSTDIMIEHGNDWVRQVKKLWHKGDVVACYANQKTGFMRKTLDQVLRFSLNMPVYILADTQSVTSSKPKFLTQVLFWFGSLAIVGGFFWAEAQLVKLPQDWAHTALIYVCVIVEISLISLWNSLLN